MPKRNNDEVSPGAGGSGVVELGKPRVSTVTNFYLALAESWQFERLRDYEADIWLPLNPTKVDIVGISFAYS